MFITSFIPSSFYDERNMFDCSKFETLFGWLCDEKRQYKMFKKPNSKVMRLNYVSYYYEEGNIIRCTSFEDEDGDRYSFKDNIKYIPIVLIFNMLINKKFIAMAQTRYLYLFLMFSLTKSYLSTFILNCCSSFSNSFSF